MKIFDELPEKSDKPKHKEHVARGKDTPVRNKSYCHICENKIIECRENTVVMVVACVILCVNIAVLLTVMFIWLKWKILPFL
jgi:hypothetical protein